jgi:hypothetical protein
MKLEPAEERTAAVLSRSGKERGRASGYFHSPNIELGAAAEDSRGPLLAFALLQADLFLPTSATTVFPSAQ